MTTSSENRRINRRVAAEVAGQASGPADKTDPTFLTNQRLMHEVEAAREFAEILVEASENNIATRINGLAADITRLQLVNDRMPDAVNASVNRIQELHAEKFRSVQTQFDAASTAVSAAFAAAKEAVIKTEVTVSKQIETLGALYATGQQAINDKIDGVKEKFGPIESRLQAMESHRQGEGDTRRGVGDFTGHILTFIIALAAVVTVVAVVLARKP